MHKKAITIIIASVLVLTVAVVGGITMAERSKAQREMEREVAEEEMRIKTAYVRLHYAFYYANSTDVAEAQQHNSQYVKLEKTSADPNRVFLEIYVSIKYYERETGGILDYDHALDYFQQEYEDDGELRLYNNGRHPEIEAYVEWMQDHRPAAEELITRLDRIYREYARNNKDSGFEKIMFYELPRQMLDELMKKEADPDYELDLISLQEQGY